MSLGASFTSAAGNNYRARFRCSNSLYVFKHTLSAWNTFILHPPTKSRGPAILPRNSTDLGAGEAGLSEDQVLHKPAIALLHKGFSSYIHRNGDLWIYFP